MEIASPIAEPRHFQLIESEAENSEGEASEQTAAGTGG